MDDEVEVEGYCLELDDEVEELQIFFMVEVAEPDEAEEVIIGVMKAVPIQLMVEMEEVLQR